MNIQSKFNLGQDVYWIIADDMTNYSFGHGKVETVHVNNEISYTVTYIYLGKTCKEDLNEDKLFESFEEMTLKILYDRKNYLNGILKETESKIEKYEKELKK